MSTLSRLALLGGCLLAIAGAAPAAAQLRTDTRAQRPNAAVGETQVMVAGRTLGRARTYSLIGTLVPVGTGVGLILTDSDTAASGLLLILAGGVAGPSAGHAYLGDWRRAWIGVGLRTAGVGAGFLVGALVAQHSTNAFTAGVSEFMVVSGVGVLVGGAYSFATLDDAARERGIAVTPAVGADGSPALAVAVRL